MSDYSFEQIEDAVLAALADLSAVNGGYLHALKSYAGELNDPERLAQAMYGKFPGVLTEVVAASYRFGTPERRSWRKVEQTVTVVLYVAAKSFRSQEEARETGAYRILQDARQRLAGQTLGLSGVYPLALERETRVYADQALVIYQAEYTLRNPNLLVEQA